MLDVGADDLTDLEGVGQVIAEAWAGWTSEHDNRELIRRMAEAGVRMADSEPEAGAGSSLLEGRVFVVTGTLPDHSRDEAKAALMQHWQSVKKSGWDMEMLLTHRFTARAAPDGSLWEVKIVRDTDLEDYLEGVNDEDPGP